MRPTRFVATAASVLFALLPLAASATNVQGTLPSDTTWNLAGSPWTITGDVTVPAGITLTIDPGVQVVFSTGDTMGSGTNTSKTELIINGTLDAQGTVTSGITINAGSGYGIRVLSGGTATLDYATVTGGSGFYGVTTAGTVTASNTTINSGYYCLAVTGGTATFNSGTLSGCRYGLYATGGTSNLAYDLIKSNSYDGVYATSAATLDHNTITGNTGTGVYVDSFSGGTFTFTNNIVASNTGSYGVQFYSTTSPTRTFHHNDVWGHSTNLYYVSGGTGALSANPLFVSSTNYRLTSNSPGRMAASDGTDLGAFPYTSDPTPGLYGTLFVNTTLPAGTYTVDGDLTVPSGVTLTLSPGAALTFASSDVMASGTNTGETELIVSGALEAQGNPNSNITLNAGSGYGIRVLSGGTATLDYATVTGGSGFYGVTTAGTFSASNSTLNSGYYCLAVTGGTATFNSGTLSGCHYGLYATGGTSNLAYDLIKSNSYDGVYASSAATLDHNTITDNTGTGVYVDSFSGGTFTFTNNIVASNTGSYGVQFYSTTSPTRTFHHNDVWGHSTNLYYVSGGTGALSSNPLFVSPGFNYTLQSTSPCRNAASDGTDMGAFPYVAVPVDHVVVTPATPSVAVNATQQFTATAYDAANNPLPSTAFTWSASASAGTINSTGLFTAGCTPGTYTAAITATGGGVSGSTSVTITTGPVATVTVQPANPTLQPNGTQQFTAEVKDACANTLTTPVSWLVVAGGGSISSGGLFTAGATPGTYNNTIKATSNGVSGQTSVTIASGAVATIDVAPTSSTLSIGGSQQFTATGKDAMGNTVPVTVTWSVVNGGGSITAAGLFTAGNTPGTFSNTIKATSGTISGYATVTVNPGPLATIVVTPTSPTLQSGAAQQFTATGKDAAGNTIPITATWSVVNGGGTISPSGVFTAGPTTGTFANTVKATSGSISGYASVTVTAGALATITVAPASSTLAINGTQTFSATGKDANGNTVPVTVTWSVVNGGGAINASSGLFTAGTTPGTFTNTIKATSGTISGFASITVQPGPAVSLVISPSTTTLGINGTQQFTVTGKDSANNNVNVTATWSVVGGGGTINASSGLFTAGTSVGSFNNTVKATSGTLSAYASVTVQAGALSSLTISPTSTSLSPGSTQQFTATGTDAAGNNVPVTVTWSVVNGGGTINATSGLFTAGNTAGTFTSTVKATTGSITAFADVTVTPSAVSTVTLTPQSISLPVHGTQQFTVEAKDSHGNVVTATPTWSVVPATAGTISTSGQFTAGAVAGNFTGAVVATVNGVSGSADVTITSGALATVTISPDVTNVPAGGTVQFNATGADADGNLVSITPSWVALNGAGTITQTGAFTASQTPGSYPESIRATANGITGTASISITAGNLMRVVISPENPLVAVQGQVSFAAHAFDAFDNEITGLTPAWAVIAGGGTIDDQGVFTAGDASGTFQNTIQVTLGGKTAATGVVVATDYDQDGLPDEWELAHGLNPNDGTDSTLDPDGDKLNNALELAAKTDPQDADSDDDGVLDGDEQKPTEDTDGDGLTNALDPDSDGDGIFDGTEMAVTTAHKDTDLARGTFLADADPTTSTDPLNKNTDGDARDDGVEDANHNGAIDDGETDPATPNTFCETDAECGADGVCKAQVCEAKPAPTPSPKPAGCGCAAEGAGSAGWFGIGLVALAWSVVRRRKVS